jgi:hypothetical protein
MTFTTTSITFKEIHQFDPDFMMTDGIKLVPRAGFDVAKECPREYLMILQTCMQKGWLKPVAYVKESDYVWEKLGD